MRNLKANQTDIMRIIASRGNNVACFKYGNKIIMTGQKEYKGKMVPFMSAWEGKQAKPFTNYVYLNERNLTNAVLHVMNKEDERQKWRENRNITAKKAKDAVNLKVGQIYVGTWGYDQTNVTSYQVIEVKGKHTAILREVAHKSLNSTSMLSDERIPCKDKFISYAKPIQKRLNKYGCFSFDCFNASLWDQKRSFHCSWGY